MMGTMARHLACVLGTVVAVPSWLLVGACSFEALGNGGPTDLMPTTSGAQPTDTTSPGATSDDPASSGGAPSEDDTTLGPPTSDSSTSGAAGTDTGEPPPVYPSGPFGEPERVAVINAPQANEDDPALSPDGLELYFESDRDTGSGDIWVARRASVDAPWEMPEVVPGINVESYWDGTPGLMPDGLTMLFISTRPGPAAGNDVYLTRRDALNMPWEAPDRVDVLSSFSDDVGPRPLPGEGLFLCSNRFEVGSVGGYDPWLYEHVDLDNRVVSPPVIVDLLATAFDECMLTMGSDGLEVFFDSNRSPSVGLVDLWSATREAVNVELEAPFSLENLNSTSDDRDPFLSPDGHELYFSSNRGGDFEIFVARR